jgi:hypothetical protein
VTVFSRRFVLLAGVLVTLNLVLWFAAPGLALRRALVLQLFGPKMVRVEVVERTPVGGSADWHIDRGVITTVSATQLTLREADGRIQQIPLAATTKVIGLGGHRIPKVVLTPRWRVVVTWPANGAAQSVDVERIPRERGRTGYAPSATPAPSLS